MAKIKQDYSSLEVIGSLNTKNGLTVRKKRFRDYEGNITSVGRLEVYKPNPRNYTVSPPRGKEKANMAAFGNASHLAQEFINALKNKTPLPPQKQALLDAYKQRFYAQLKGTPDPVAPKDKDGNFTIYARMDNFIRAVIRKEPPALSD
ncbi:MAG: hypothetical protein IJ204_03605 [Paludibacteraceae bacterium]|nr:hypothetical protein [Paludibacteraceae bacterium]